MRYTRYFTESSVPKAEAYWISPTGKILALKNNERHIDLIIKNPRVFGFSLDEIQELYDKNGEELGVEGVAREQLIKGLLMSGWIRIRRYVKSDMFTVNISRLHKKAKNYLYMWANAMKDQGLKFSQVKLDLPNKVVSYSIDDITKDVLFNKGVENCELTVIHSVDEFKED